MTVWFEKKLGLGRLGDGEDMLHDVMVASLLKGLYIGVSVIPGVERNEPIDGHAEDSSIDASVEFE